MATGNKRGQIECFFQTPYIDPPTTFNIGRDFMSSLYRFMEYLSSTGACERVALRYGILSDGSPSSGTGYHDDPSPLGNQSFFVYRFKKSGEVGTTTSRQHSIYVLFQLGSGVVNPFGFASGGASPGQIQASNDGAWYHVGVSVAVALDSTGNDANPWNGGTAGNGTDTKGTPVWVAPAGGSLYVWPRSNNPSGSHATNRENCMTVVRSGGPEGSTLRAHFTADNDNLTIVSDVSDSGYYNHLWTMQTFTKMPSLTQPVSLLSYYCQPSVGLPGNIVLGGLAGNEVPNGGTSVPDGTQGVGRAILNWDAAWMTTYYQPSRLYDPYRWDLFPQSVGATDPWSNQIGVVGRADSMPQVFNIATNDTLGGMKRLVVGGSTTLALAKPSIYWDESTTPRSGVTRSGIQFNMTP